MVAVPTFSRSQPVMAGAANRDQQYPRVPRATGARAAVTIGYIVIIGKYGRSGVFF
jgi:hypothetical protein